MCHACGDCSGFWQGRPVGDYGLLWEHWVQLIPGPQTPGWTKGTPSFTLTGAIYLASVCLVSPSWCSSSKQPEELIYSKKILTNITHSALRMNEDWGHGS